MKKIILSAFIALAALTASAQQLRTSYFMEGSTVRNNLNPAFRPTRGYVDIPVLGSIYAGFTSNAFALDDIFYPDGNGGLRTILNRKVTYDLLNEKLRGINTIGFDVETSILGVGFYSGKNGFLDFGLDLRVDGGVSIPDDMIAFMKKGSGSYNMCDISAGTSTYAVLSAGYSHRILPELTVGARVRYLGGLGRVNMHFDKLDLRLDGEEWSVDAVGVLDVMAKGVDVGVDEDGYIDFDTIDYTPRGLAGNGFSFDFGATYRLFETVNLSVSILDLGMVKWKSDATIRSVSRTGYSFTGFEIKGRDNVTMGYGGDLDDFLKFEKGHHEGVSTKLRSTILVGAELPLLRDYVSVGVIYMLKQNEYMRRSEFSAALTFRPASWFTAALSYSFDEVKNLGGKGINSLGLAVNFHAPWINFFLGTDYMVARVAKQGVPLGQKVFNYYMGISIPLGKERMTL